MDTLTLDVRNLPDEKIRELQRLAARWKREADGAPVARVPVAKRKVRPDEFAPGLTKFKAPLTRALAYEE